MEPFLRSVVPVPQLLSSWLSWEHPFTLSQGGSRWDVLECDWYRAALLDLSRILRVQEVGPE